MSLHVWAQENFIRYTFTILSTILLSLTRKTIIIVMSPISTLKPMYQSLTLPSTKKDFQLLAANTFTVRNMSKQQVPEPTDKCEYFWLRILVTFQKKLINNFLLNWMFDNYNKVTDLGTQIRLSADITEVLRGHYVNWWLYKSGNTTPCRVQRLEN